MYNVRRRADTAEDWDEYETVRKGDRESRMWKCCKELLDRI